MASGIGVGPDSVMFLSSAESWLAGRGLTPIAYHFTPLFPAGKPLVGLAPTYPLLLALGHFLTTNMLTEARCLHALLFGLNTFLIGSIAYWSTRKSMSATIAAATLFMISAHVLEQLAIASSEAPFITFTLLATFMLLLYLERRRFSLLIAASLAAALAMTTRFVGVTILPAMLLAILFYRKRSLTRTLRDCAIALIVALGPLLAVLVHNRTVAGTSTNRTLAFHAVGLSDLGNLSVGFAAFLLPFNVPFALGLVVLALCAVLIAAAILTSLPNHKRGKDENRAAQFFSAVFTATYLSFLVVYNSLANPAVELSTRTLLPFYVFAIVVVVTFANGSFGRSRIVWKSFLLLTILIVLLNARYTAAYVKYRHEQSFGFANSEWTGSATMAYARSLPPGTVVYSNAIDAIFLLTHKDALRIPAKIDPSTGQANNDFASSMSQLQEALRNDNAVVVYFDKVTWRWYLPSKDELEKVHQLPVRRQLADGVIYGLPPH